MREKKSLRLATGRPRLLTTDGKERLLDDNSTEALPVWCPDSSKVATGFDNDVMIYDAATNKPTQARIKLSDALVAASRVYEDKSSGKNKGDNQEISRGSRESGSRTICDSSVVKSDHPSGVDQPGKALL